MARMAPGFLLLACGLLVGCGSDSLPVGRQDTAAEPADTLSTPPADAARADLAPDAGAPADTRPPSDGLPADAEEPEPDGGASEPVKCLPDGSGRFILQTTGGLDIDVALGNDVFCPGSVGADGTGYLNWAVPAKGTDLKAAFNVTVRGLMKGLTSNARPVEMVVLIAGDMGNIWNAPDVCKMDLTANGPAPGAAANVFKLTGVIRCPPISGQRQPTPPLTITRFEFTSAVTFE